MVSGSFLPKCILWHLKLGANAIPDTCQKTSKMGALFFSYSKAVVKLHSYRCSLTLIPHWLPS